MSLNSDFVLEFSEFQREAAVINHDKGFDGPDRAFELILRSPFIGGGVLQCLEHHAKDFEAARAGLKLALIGGELGEALEAVRKNLGTDDHIPEFTAEEAEIADAVIRIMNYATDRKLRLAEAIVAKNEYNRNRKDHSKEARASEHGKRF
jgi:NTP pyrophosphatase (non-canonical NTP hydrolase)